MILMRFMNMKRFIAIAVLFAALPLVAQKKAFTIEDFYRVKSAMELDVAPDGSRYVFTVTSSDLPKAKRTTRIWIGEVNGANPHQLTRGDADKNGRFSPDGKSVVFIRENNLWILPLAGGEAHALTESSMGVADPVWSPNGKWIAFSSDVYPECGGDVDCSKRINERWQQGPLKAHMADSLLYR